MANENKTPTREQGTFSIQKIYTKDISFETPHSPDIFKMNWQPSVDMNLAHEANSIETDMFEVVLSITITVTFEDTTVYLVEIKQAGIFKISDMPATDMEKILGITCPNIIFPFAREQISDLITRGGFPQLLLAPINFESLYLHEKQQHILSEHKTQTTH